jgi:hypothetical protein
MLLTPTAWQTPYTSYACDNGVYANFMKGRGWDNEMDVQYREMLSKLPADNPPMWVLLPDVVADWKATVELGRIYLPILKQLCIPVAVALQDGCDFNEALQFDPDWVFVGGSTEWKLANVSRICQFFRPKGIKVHVGRVNTARRVRLCQSAGADSCDGTTLNKFCNKNLPRVSRELHQGCFVLWEDEECASI